MAGGADVVEQTVGIGAGVEMAGGTECQGSDVGLPGLVIDVGGVAAVEAEDAPVVAGTDEDGAVRGGRKGPDVFRGRTPDHIGMIAGDAVEGSVWGGTGVKAARAVETESEHFGLRGGPDKSSFAVRRDLEDFAGVAGSGVNAAVRAERHGPEGGLIESGGPADGGSRAQASVSVD